MTLCLSQDGIIAWRIGYIPCTAFLPSAKLQRSQAFRHVHFQRHTDTVPFQSLQLPALPAWTSCWEAAGRPRSDQSAAPLPAHCQKLAALCHAPSWAPSSPARGKTDECRTCLRDPCKPDVCAISSHTSLQFTPLTGWTQSPPLWSNKTRVELRILRSLSTKLCRDTAACNMSLALVSPAGQIAKDRHTISGLGESQLVR